MDMKLICHVAFAKLFSRKLDLQLLDVAVLV